MNPPDEESGPYYNYGKGKGINTLVVSNASSLKFYYASSGHPGHRHDAPIFKESGLYFMLDQKHWKPINDALIVADSAYEVSFVCKAHKAKHQIVV